MKSSRRYLLEQTAGGFAVNAILNGVPPWYIFPYLGYTSIPLLGTVSVVGDFLAMAFFLPFIVCMIVTRVTQSKVSTGKVRRLAQAPSGFDAIGHLPKSVFQRSLIVGAFSVLVTTAGLLLSASLMDLGEVSLVSFCAAKAVLAGFMAALVTAMAASRAMLGEPLHAKEG